MSHAGLAMHNAHVGYAAVATNMEVTQEHVSAGCNRVVGALDWGDHLVAYAAHNLVCLYDAEAAKVVATMIGHTDRVNCVQWLATSGADAGISGVLASGAADNNVIIWLSHADKPNRPWSIAAKLEGHSGAVVALAHLLVGDTLLLFSSAEDTQVLVWECSLGPARQQGTHSPFSRWTLRQKLDTGQGLQHCLAAAEIPGQEGWLLVAMGGVDCSIKLALAPPGGSFLPVCSLTGHADWVRSLAFTQPQAAGTQQGHLLLASASQDKYLRVWRIQPQSPPQSAAHHKPAPTSGPNSTGSNGNLANDIARYAPKPQFSTPRGQYTAFLEALLVGHEDWVHSVQWQPSPGQGQGLGQASSQQGLQAQPLCLLSTSMDRSMMLWRPDPLTGLWMSEESVGDAGANNLGYFTGCFSPQGTSILAHGFTGALHLWKRPEAQGGVGWEPGHALGGHYGAVVDMCWGVDGSCLLTASTDQTCRITAQIQGGWSELARPQVHGHDLSCLAYIPASSCYVSGAEEKVLRVFQAPQAFTQTLAMAQGRSPPHTPQSSTPHTSQSPALGAAVAALGLSNKAVYAEEVQGSNAGVASGMEGGGYTDGPDLAPNAAPAAVAGPPLEEHLAQSSLWPEIAKLYGHGAELFCVAASPSGDVLASACKAQTSSTAAVWLWDTTTWAALGSLTAHSLTVTQLRFSPDGRWLLSVSRDRTVAVYQRGTGSIPFTLQHRIKAHARIIWGAAWSPDSAAFATASRDGSVRLWSCSKLSNTAKPSATITLGQPVTAIAFEARHTSASIGSNRERRQYRLALGLETGTLSVYTVSREGNDFVTSRLWESSADCSHCAPVRQICWHTGHLDCQESYQKQTSFGSCSDDHCIRIFKIRNAI